MSPRQGNPSAKNLNYLDYVQITWRYPLLNICSLNVALLRSPLLLVYFSVDSLASEVIVCRLQVDRLDAVETDSVAKKPFLDVISCEREDLFL